LHVSLSRPLTLHTTTKSTFLSTLQTRLCDSFVSPFDVRFTTLKWEANATRTRWFLVLGIAKPEIHARGGGDELNKLLRVCNQLCAEMGLGGLYNDGSVEVRAQEKKERLEKEAAYAQMKATHKYKIDWGTSLRGVDRYGKVVEKTEAEKKKEEEEAEKRKVLAKDADRTECFHVSLAWRLTAPEDEDAVFGGEEEKEAVDGGADGDGDGKQKLAELMHEVQKLRVSIDTVKIKIGSTVTSVSLDDKKHPRRFGGIAY